MKLRELPLFKAVREARVMLREGVPLNQACVLAARKHTVDAHTVAGFVRVARDRGNTRGQTP